MRYRLFTRTLQAVLQYAALLLLFGVAVYEGLCVPFLAATLCSELYSVLFLAGKLQGLAGAWARARALVRGGVGRGGKGGGGMCMSTRAHTHAHTAP